MDGTLQSDDERNLLYDESYDPIHASAINFNVGEEYGNALHEEWGELKKNDDTNVQLYEVNQDSVDEQFEETDSEERETHLHSW